MPVDYNSISDENTRKYGTDIKRIGGMLLSDRYDDRTHFIFELLQNAEDALAKRGASWNGSRTVTFSLSPDELTISHFGKPFDEADVQGVCGIGESTKEELTDIGRFGIGFKSVYAFTDNPEIHSRNEHFAIDDYVHPRQVNKRCLQPEETMIRIPFKKTESDAKDKILNGLRNLNTRTLLFLRQIEEIHWADTVDGISGLYMRGKRDPIGSNARKVVLIGQDDENGDVEEDYIVFSKDVSKESTSVGHVEIAFALETSNETEHPEIQPATNTELVAFFPTVLPTNMGFVMQGPYRTTPSRDNVPEDDEWNRHLIKETSHLLIDALKELRRLGLLNVSAIKCLPLDNSLSRFTPLFNAVRDALRTEQLLPAYNGGYIAGQNAMLARGLGLRDLISPAQLTKLYESDGDRLWLSPEITENRTSQLYQYLTDTLDVGEVTPTDLLRRLDKTFLEEQPDEWIARLYEFLNVQGAYRILTLMHGRPLVRLENGTHTVAQVDDLPQAYLPTENKTGFPIVRASVCQPDEAIEFLKYLGLREPDLVDDVIAHVLPKYRKQTVNVSDAEYQSDINRMLNAYGTDSREQRIRLVDELKKARFIAATDAASGSTQFVLPEEAYQATEALKNLFEGVSGVLFVDNSKEYFRGERIRDLLRATGTPEYLARIRVEPSLSSTEKRELRHKSGDSDITYERSVEDYSLMGLDPLLDLLSTLSTTEASKRAELLWDALCLFERSGYASAFNGIYRWFRYSDRQAPFSANFIRLLNERVWVPDDNGVLRLPREVIFDDTGWDEDPILTSKIEFMPNAVTKFAEEAGISLEMAKLLHDCTPEQEEQIMEILKKGGEKNTQNNEYVQSDESDNTFTNESNGAELDNQAGKNETDSQEKQESVTQSGHTGTDNGVASANGKQSSPAKTKKEFISYVAVTHDENYEESDGLTHEERMSLESQAIDFILSNEPTLQKTPINNPGFDLFEEDSQNVRVKYVEVKSMKASLENRPATLTRTQFKFAQEKQDAFWLYVVESAGDPQAANIIRIQNPAGKAKIFTFDHGWRNAAEALGSQI